MPILCFLLDQRSAINFQDDVDTVNCALVGLQLCNRVPANYIAGRGSRTLQICDRRRKYLMLRGAPPEPQAAIQTSQCVKDQRYHRTDSNTSHFWRSFAPSAAYEEPFSLPLDPLSISRSSWLASRSFPPKLRPLGYIDRTTRHDISDPPELISGQVRYDGLRLPGCGYEDDWIVVILPACVMTLNGAQLIDTTGYLRQSLFANLYHGVVSEPPPPDLKSLSSVFFALHLAGGHIGLPLLVATFCISKTTKRHLTVINFCIVWILYSIIYCLL